MNNSWIMQINHEKVVKWCQRVSLVTVIEISVQIG